MKECNENEEIETDQGNSEKNQKDLKELLDIREKKQGDSDTRRCLEIGDK